MAWLTAAVVTSTVLSAGSAVGQAVAQRRAAAQTADAGRRMAADAAERGEEEVARYQRELAQVVGRQRAQAASQGLALDRDSAGQIVADAERIGAIDIETIRANAMREAMGITSQATQQARALRTASAASFAGAAGTAIAGGVDAWSVYRAGRGPTVTTPLRALPAAGAGVADALPVRRNATIGLGGR